jgi:hypothetical protein
MWETVRYHDPIDGDNLSANTDRWIDETWEGSGHTIDSLFIAYGAANWTQHGAYVLVPGGPGGGDWPPEI